MISKVWKSCVSDDSCHTVLLIELKEIINISQLCLAVIFLTVNFRAK